ncbi:hypothetical protein F5882DRAFT_497007 [Hyaloscypha sp. PMI_1271]|nr:hypothetical protein F5882DRAFT_497007 [Hyaloscypha sp. PMI_1271]
MARGGRRERMDFSQTLENSKSTGNGYASWKTNDTKWAGIGECYAEDPDNVALYIKSGVSITKGSNFHIDGQAEGLRNSVDNANKILDGENYIDVFGPAKVNPKVPIETASEVLAQLLKGGKIGSIQFPKFELTHFDGRPWSAR